MHVICFQNTESASKMGLFGCLCSFPLETGIVSPVALNSVQLLPEMHGQTTIHKASSSRRILPFSLGGDYKRGSNAGSMKPTETGCPNHLRKHEGCTGVVFTGYVLSCLPMS